MNNKGFTLIEVVVALTLITVIGLILVLNINTLTGNQVENEYERIMDRIVSAADVYVSNDPDLKNRIFVNDETITITIKLLVDQGLLDEKDLINPKTNKNFIGVIKISAPEQILTIEYDD